MLPSNNAQDLTQTLFNIPVAGQNQKKKTYLVVITDTHGGHILGLMCPDVMCYNEDRDGNLIPYVPTLNVAQEELFAIYTKLIEKVKLLAGDEEVVLFHLGDITQGTFRPKELISTRIADHISIATKSIEHFVDTVSLNRIRAIRIVKGTGSHVFGEGSSESLVRMFIEAKYPGLDVREVYHGLADIINGVTIDYSHHGPVTGSREWIRGDDARRYLRDRMLKDILAGREPPKLYLRGHVHDYIHETLRMNGFESDLVICPSLTFLDDYARKATRSIHKLTIGGMIFEISAGRITDFIPVKETLDLRTKETI